MIFDLNYFNFTDNFIVASFAWLIILCLSALLLWVLGKIFHAPRNSFLVCLAISSYQFISLVAGVLILLITQLDYYEAEFYLGGIPVILLVALPSYFFIHRYFLLSKKKAFVFWLSWIITQVVILGGYMFISFLSLEIR